MLAYIVRRLLLMIGHQLMNLSLQLLDAGVARIEPGRGHRGCGDAGEKRGGEHRRADRARSINLIHEIPLDRPSRPAICI